MLEIPQQFRPSLGPGTRLKVPFAAREQVTRYLARKPSAEVEKALRLLEIALGDAEKK